MNEDAYKILSKQLEYAEKRIGKVEAEVDRVHLVIYEDIKLKLGGLEQKVDRMSGIYEDARKLLMRSISVLVVCGSSMLGVGGWGVYELSDINLSRLSKQLAEFNVMMAESNRINLEGMKQQKAAKKEVVPYRKQ